MGLPVCPGLVVPSVATVALLPGGASGHVAEDEHLVLVASIGSHVVAPDGQTVAGVSQPFMPDWHVTAVVFSHCAVPAHVKFLVRHPESLGAHPVERTKQAMSPSLHRCVSENSWPTLILRP
jgi:hypothetical protein